MKKSCYHTIFDETDASFSQRYIKSFLQERLNTFLQEWKKLMKGSSAELYKAVQKIG